MCDRRSACESTVCISCVTVLTTKACQATPSSMHTMQNTISFVVRACRSPKPTVVSVAVAKYSDAQYRRDGGSKNSSARVHVTDLSVR